MEERKLNLASQDHFGQDFSAAAEEEEETIRLVHLLRIPIIPLHHIKHIKLRLKHKVGLQDFGLDWQVVQQLDTVSDQEGAQLRLHRIAMLHLPGQNIQHQGRVMGLEVEARVGLVIRVRVGGRGMIMGALAGHIQVQGLAELGDDSWMNGSWDLLYKPAGIQIK